MTTVADFSFGYWLCRNVNIDHGVSTCFLGCNLQNTEEHLLDAVFVGAEEQIWISQFYVKFDAINVCWLMTYYLNYLVSNGFHI